MINKLIKNEEKQKDTPLWKQAEKIASLLEKILSPTAKVEYNVQLPVLGRERKRQCDVVITSGESPRQIITIVEVQKRNSKPSITTFHGWYAKMQEVGAQRLICVSALGYPKSIIDEVRLKYGPTIQLLTLKELEETKIHNLIFPLNFIIHQSATFSVESFGQIKLENPPGVKVLEFSSEDQVFEVEGTIKKININELIGKALDDIYITDTKGNISELETYKIELTLGSAEKGLWLYIGEQKLKVLKLPIKVNINHSYSKIPIKHFEYKQDDIEDVTAWVVSAKGNGVDGKEVSLELIFKPDKNGLLQLFSSNPMKQVKMHFYPNKKDLLKKHK